MAKFTIRQCSAAARAMIDTAVSGHGRKPSTYTETRGRPAKYPWRDMAVGQSFRVDITNPETTESMLRKAAGDHGRRNGKTFAAIKTGTTLELARIK